MTLAIDALFNLPDRRRRRFKFGLRHRRRYKPEKRPDRTREEIIGWVKENDIRSPGQLLSKRKNGDPNIYDVRKLFGGSWKQAMLEIHGPPDDPTTGDPLYLARLVVQFDIRSRAQYIEARNKRPDVVPSLYYVKKHYGTFRNLMGCKNRISLNAMLDDYIKLVRRLGYFPSRTECRQMGAPLDRAISYFGSKKKLDDFIKNMEKAHETAR